MHNSFGNDYREEMDTQELLKTSHTAHLYYSDSDDSEEEFRQEEFAGLKEQMYYDKLTALKKQLGQLREGSHPDYKKKMKKVDSLQKDRLRMNELVKEMELERVEKDHIMEKKLSLKEFEEKKAELKENLLLELEEKKRLIEQERHSLDLNGDSLEYKAVSTRKLRRRGAEPTPTVEKRRKPGVATSLQFLLDERQVDDDLRTIGKAKAAYAANKHNNKASPPLPSTPLECHSNEPKIENGKLYFDKKWFHKGQPVLVECKDGSRFNAVLSCAESNLIHVRKVSDSSRLKISLAQLAHGKYLVKRRHLAPALH